MKCREAEGQLSGFLDENVSKELHRRIKTHLRGCKRCQSRLSLLKKERVPEERPQERNDLKKGQPSLPVALSPISESDAVSFEPPVFQKSASSLRFMPALNLAMAVLVDGKEDNADSVTERWTAEHHIDLDFSQRLVRQVVHSGYNRLIAGVRQGQAFGGRYMVRYIDQNFVSIDILGLLESGAMVRNGSYVIDYDAQGNIAAVPHDQYSGGDTARDFVRNAHETIERRAQRARQALLSEQAFRCNQGVLGRSIPAPIIRVAESEP